MKFFHLSDLHIGLRLFNHDLFEDQKYVFNQIITIAAAEKPDAVVIAGDIYDKAIPSADAVKIFDEFISDLSDAVPDSEIMVISGNHDSAARINVFRDILKYHKIHMIGLPPQTTEDHIEKITLHDNNGNVNFYLLPFVKPSMVKEVVGTDENGNNLSYNDTVHKLIERENIDISERNVLVSHQFYLPKDKNSDEIERMDSECYITVGNIDSISADVLDNFDYAALGHIHKPMKVGSDNYRYCGTPMQYSVSESGQQKGIISVELLEKGNVKTEIIPLKSLHQVRVVKGPLEEVLNQGSEDYISILLTDKEDLDVIDMRERIRTVFPNFLEIRREQQVKVNYQSAYNPEEKKDVFELFNEFLPDLDEYRKTLLQQIINKVQEDKQ